MSEHGSDTPQEDHINHEDGSPLNRPRDRPLATTEHLRVRALELAGAAREFSRVFLAFAQAADDFARQAGAGDENQSFEPQTSRWLF
ncbi:hypothetical protein PFICI_00375 [Pestalotiopsis fici W106-1]|uniref:Uncharacterized protein n=1 Tax=Pestalotiopsis fici (strain W106-1 / CGMCC3.15140) TaxID=1229662 RepID=W3XM34_PESFW|nr:uncharacterized protein PFICI_00375 [Pestalotiopsis fici W106-1]ETS86547.1 hypothetical protein PFICI_00375 [Pestalotiopsis fici W106-1]